jgi:hypothetical protein
MSLPFQSTDFSHEFRVIGPVIMAVILLSFKSPTPIVLPRAPEPVQNPGKINRLCSERTLLLQSALDFIHWGLTLPRLQSGYLVYACCRSDYWTMQANSQERRTMRRFDMRLPAIIRLGTAGEFQTETQNVSARGVFFYLDRPISAGTKLEVTLTFPPHVTLTEAVRVRFKASVIRVESPLPSARIGVAALIEDYEFVRSNGTTDFQSVLQRESQTPN